MFGDTPAQEMMTRETWRLEKAGRILEIRQHRKSFRGMETAALIYEKY